ncbi:Titin [Labeo rohita]|uniref:Titin n=1 Tax=Labeo rohita TaxID=84645 RepID=A0ABQ8LCY2_LABRO|nr:Titin [Labeo rohita]
MLTCPLSSLHLRSPLSPLFPRPAHRGLRFPRLAQRGLLLPCPPQRGLLFPSPTQRETLFLSPVQRGFLFPRASREPGGQQMHAPASFSAVVWQPLWSPSAHCAVGSPRVCQSPSASWLEDPLSLPPASESRTPLRPIDPAAPPWLLTSSSLPWPGSPLVHPGSLVPPAPPWSSFDHPAPWNSIPPAVPRPSVPTALSGSSIPSASPWSSVALAPPWPPGSTSPPRPSGSSPSPWLIGSPPLAPPPPAPPPSVGPLESSTVPPQWLLPPSAPPWVVIMAVAWVSPGSSCSKSLQSSSWLLPLSGVSTPPEPPPKFPPILPSVVSMTQGHAFREGGKKRPLQGFIFKEWASDMRNSSAVASKYTQLLLLASKGIREPYECCLAPPRVLKSTTMHVCGAADAEATRRLSLVGVMTRQINDRIFIFGCVGVMGLGMKFERLRRHMGFLEDLQTWADISGSQRDKWESNHAP